MLTWLNYVESFKRAEVGLPLGHSMLMPSWFVGPAVWVVILTFFWNGLFFLQRVIESYTRHSLKIKAASGADEGKDD